MSCKKEEEEKCCLVVQVCRCRSFSPFFWFCLFIFPWCHTKKHDMRVLHNRMDVESAGIRWGGEKGTVYSAVVLHFNEVLVSRAVKKDKIYNPNENERDTHWKVFFRRGRE